MLAYIDSSVLLRKVFGEPQVLAELEEVDHAVASELIQVECLRTADRYRVANGQSESEYLERVDLIHRALRSLELVRVAPEILRRASQPFPSALGTLDALHLATCLAYASRRPEIVLCSHDEGLKRAARAVGFATLG